MIDDFVSYWQNMKRKYIFLLIDGGKIKILIGLSFITGQIMIKLHKMQIFIIHSKPLSDHEIKVSCMARISAFIDPGFLLP